MKKIKDLIVNIFYIPFDFFGWTVFYIINWLEMKTQLDSKLEEKFYKDVENLKIEVEIEEKRGKYEI